jgi:hypothetical protein
VRGQISWDSLRSSQAWSHAIDGDVELYLGWGEAHLVGAGLEGDGEEGAAGPLAVEFDGDSEFDVAFIDHDGRVDGPGFGGWVVSVDGDAGALVDADAEGEDGAVV